MDWERHAQIVVERRIPLNAILWTNEAPSFHRRFIGYGESIASSLLASASSKCRRPIHRDKCPDLERTARKIARSCAAALLALVCLACEWNEVVPSRCRFGRARPPFCPLRLDCQPNFVIPLCSPRKLSLSLPCRTPADVHRKSCSLFVRAASPRSISPPRFGCRTRCLGARQLADWRGRRHPGQPSKFR